MKPSREVPAAAGIMEALRSRANGRHAVSFADFMDVALYDPAAGYYRKDGPRIGYGPGTDFLTATASAPLFGRLVVAACGRLLAPGAPADFEFVEIGAEDGAGVLRDSSHPFRAARQVGVGETLRLEGPSVVFSNELFDAQPFRRFRFRSGAWREIGVAVGGDFISEVELEPGEPVPAQLPEAAPEDYVIDAPFASAALARSIAGQPWAGLFIAFDYGKAWEEIISATPFGTARAYRRHAQTDNLLACAGDQDLTCHVCWDWLKEALVSSGFADPRVESQEAFFIGHAGAFIKAFTASEAGRLSREKLSLLQLLHPAHMGQKFQVLWALRPASSAPRRP